VPSKNVKPGDKITAVYNSTLKRHVILLRVIKVGRKWLHGVTIFFEPDGQKREGHPMKVDLETSEIYPGLRHDMRAVEFKHQDDYRLWKQARQQRQEDYAWELREFIREKMDLWDLDNPMPERTEFPTPEMIQEVLA